MKRILIIDDEEAIREMLVMLMEREGYKATAAEDGEVAEELFSQEEFDLVITDLIMPNKEGVETIMAFKKIKPDMPIIAISGGAKMKPDCYLNIAQQLGADYTFAKPFKSKELLETVKKCLG